MLRCASIPFQLASTLKNCEKSPLEVFKLFLEETCFWFYVVLDTCAVFAIASL